MKKVEIFKLHPDAKLPERGSELAAGWDVTATQISVNGTQAICRLGFVMQIPEGYRVSIVPRSSLTKTNWVLQNSPGTVDADYRGEVQVRFRAIPEKIVIATTNKELFEVPSFPYEVGDRIAQIYLEKVIETEYVEIFQIGETARGEGGFGSTGK